MSALRKRLNLRRPEPYLGVLLAVLAILAFDAIRPAPVQWTGRAYISAVRLYQHYGRAATRSVIACRYHPTCSEYSIEAVARFGVISGGRMTLRRLLSCRGGLAPGTPDPVPPTTAGIKPFR